METIKKESKTQAVVKLEMKMKIDEVSFDTLKRMKSPIEKFIEELLDLEYPEIRSIFDIQLVKI